MKQDTEKTKEEIFTETAIGDGPAKKPAWRELLDTILYLAGLVFVCWFILTFITQRTVVSGTSMAPTLDSGQSIFLDKVSYRFHDPERFDIIVFRYQNRRDRHYIKRIIGLPGETVQIVDSVIYINGQPIDDPYRAEPVMISAGRASQPITLGENEYFVMGDNRNGSSDSRMEDVGNITRKMIIGRAFLRVWPLKSFGIIHHAQ